MNRRLPAVTPRKVVRVLEKAGFVLIRVSGSHHIYGERLEALLPPEHHKALAGALRQYCGSRRYREALAAEGAVRWSVTGEPLELVSAEHRAHALRRLGRQDDASA